jgi:H+-transporting ATPase
MLRCSDASLAMGRAGAVRCQKGSPMTGPAPATARPQDDAERPLPELQARLGMTADGLSPEVVQQRQAQFGFNELVVPRERPWLKFLGYFWGPIPWMIEGAVLLSALVGHWADFGIILVLLLANACVGFWEEFHAGNAIDALKAKLALKARVRRGGSWQTCPARELVPGDVIRVRLGDIVPADARLLTAGELEVDQSALTGESLPVARGQAQAVYSGAIVRRGEADALVYGTGRHTFFGQTAQLVAEAHTTSHFQRAVLKIGNYLIVLAAGLVALILMVALFRGDAMLTTLQFALVLTVAAIPVAMPTVLSVTMAVGANTLARKQAIVSRLAAIEELAGMDVLCSDKTGTLTQNALTLGEPFTLGGVTADELVLCGALASRAEDEDTIDLTVLAGVKDTQALQAHQVTAFQPFDPVGKRTEATVRDPSGAVFKVSKGAPQVILALVAGADGGTAPDAQADAMRAEVEATIARFAQRGFRSLGVARTDAAGRWRFLGILPLYDPPRADSKATIAAARDMGVKMKMVTGDQLAIGREIAGQLGMGTALLDASGFGDVRHHESAQVGQAIETADGFAQVFPEHKYYIVDVLQQRGHIVGMTGDGVNDAPALKKADCGIAVSGATDAARAAADIVLLTPGLSVIVDAIRESRKIFQRMNSYAIYRITETIRVLLFMTLSILVFNFYPVTAVMIVLLALLNDGAILTIAYDKVRYSDQPEAWAMSTVLTVSTVLGVTGVLASFGLFYVAERVWHVDRALIQSLMYLKLSVAGHLTIFATRTRGPFWSVRPARAVWVAVFGTQLLATLIAVYGWFMPAIGWTWALGVWAYALVCFLINDQIKQAVYRSGWTSPSTNPAAPARAS